MRLKAVLALALLIAVALVSVGCQAVEEALSEDTQPAEQAIVAAPGAPVDGELHEQTPAELPMWPDATVEYSTLEANAYSLLLITDSALDEVVNGLAVGLNEAGWEAVADDITGEPGVRVAVLTVKLGDIEGFITVNEMGDGTTAIEYLLTLPE